MSLCSFSIFLKQLFKFCLFTAGITEISKFSARSCLKTTENAKLLHFSFLPNSIKMPEWLFYLVSLFFSGQISSAQETLLVIGKVRCWNQTFSDDVNVELLRKTGGSLQNYFFVSKNEHFRGHF